MQFTLRVRDIEPQDDTTGPPDTGALWANDLWAGQDPRRVIQKFRRLVARASIAVDGAEYPIRLIMHVRADNVAIIAKGCPVSAQRIAYGLGQILRKYGMEGGHGDAARVIRADQKNNMILLAVPDAEKVAGILHDVAETAGESAGVDETEADRLSSGRRI